MVKIRDCKTPGTSANMDVRGYENLGSKTSIYFCQRLKSIRELDAMG